MGYGEPRTRTTLMAYSKKEEELQKKWGALPFGFDSPNQQTQSLGNFSIFYTFSIASLPPQPYHSNHPSFLTSPHLFIPSPSGTPLYVTRKVPNREIG